MNIENVVVRSEFDFIHIKYTIYLFLYENKPMVFLIVHLFAHLIFIFVVVWIAIQWAGMEWSMCLSFITEILFVVHTYKRSDEICVRIINKNGYLYFDAISHIFRIQEMTAENKMLEKNAVTLMVCFVPSKSALEVIIAPK